MRILSLVILFAVLYFSTQKTDSPHGKGFNISCKTCHSPKGWQLDKEIYSFNHDRTKLPLKGQHREINCRDCHKSLVFSDVKSECIQCHSDIHQNTVGQDCSRCHTPVSWLVNNIDAIHRASRFPLLGAHRTTDCIACHKSESNTRFDVSGVLCMDCHRQSYLSTTNPNHSAAGFSEDCTLCHSISSLQWQGAGFNHSMFPLEQGHSTAKCVDCHTSGNFTEAKPECYSCHQNDFVATKSPDHAAAKISTACQECHTLVPGWKPTNFDHTVFPLKLGHSTPACIDCHAGGNYTSTPPDCYSCHSTNYLGTTTPNHTSSGFSKNCQSCHTLTPGWKPATIDHSKFPLTLGHAGSACTDCHKSTNYSTTSPDCYSCHQANYNSTVNPNHKASGFPTTCVQCHTTTPGWRPASFNHTKFPLTLGHSIPSCSACHTNGNYTTTPTDCYSCHLIDYNSSANPNHKTLAFSTVCTTCHTTSPGWKPASYVQHDAQMFPIYSGKHKGKWTLCSDCHDNPANYTLFNCKKCHSDAHRGKNYTNAQCYSCHPRGTGG